MESLQHKVLDFPEPDESFDPNFIPEDGTQYLQKVAHERKHCPDIVVKPFVNSTPSQPISWNTLLQTDFVDTASVQLRPSEEWKKVQISEFLSIRQRISSMRELFRLNMPDNLPKLPEISDPKSWLEFCKNNSPILRIVLQIDQRMLEVLLDYQLKWLEDSTTSGLALAIEDSWLGTWIYSTLSCLHLPLEPNTHSLLRQVAKCCVNGRNRLTVDDVVLATPFNLLICIISGCFDQRDFKSMV
ncbi:protein Gemin2 [Bradysia coprophila]|uniref:protein Gemin2 n=1 Tax=Bradysia coprophila TaxID=38358 RepID=UPI00187DDA7F|nr:protein Gemin2 [Bradysia coprophila]